jgi:hypothetical protein
MAGERFRLIARNLFDTATLSCNVAALTNSSLENLKNDRRSRVVRWPTSGMVSVKGDYNGAGGYVSGFCLDRFNLEPAATVRFRGFSGVNQTGATVVDTGTVPAYVAATLGTLQWGIQPLGSSIFDGFGGYKFWNVFFARALILSWQLDITDNNSQGYIEAGRGILGDYMEPAANADYGLKLGWKENTEQEEMDGGSLLSDGRLPRRALNGTFPDLSESERAAWQDVIRYVGKRKAFLATFQPEVGGALERDYCLPRAKFSELPDLSWDYPTGHALPFSIVEA